MSVVRVPPIITIPSWQAIARMNSSAPINSSKADMIREEIQSPICSIGGALGAQLGETVDRALGLENEK